MKKKFNVIDLLIILIVAIAIVVLAVFLKSYRESEVSETKIAILEATEQRKSVADAVTTGDIGFNGEKNIQLGEIVDFEVKPAQKERFSELSGKAVMAEVPGRYDITLKLEVPEDLDIMVGEQIWLATSVYKCKTFVIDVKEAE